MTEEDINETQRGSNAPVEYDFSVARENGGDEDEDAATIPKFQAPTLDLESLLEEAEEEEEEEGEDESGDDQTSM